MAEFLPVKASIQARLNTGTNPDTGRPIVRNVSMSRVNPDITAAGFKAVADLLEPVFEVPVAEFRFLMTDMLDA